jgi:hypothetical protein
LEVCTPWFRSSNTRARYLPNFNYSGRLAILVWSVPAMTVLLVGGAQRDRRQRRRG